jgi:hypothetical protein
MFCMIFFMIVFFFWKERKLPIIENLELVEFTRLYCVVQKKSTQTFGKLCIAQILPFCDLNKNSLPEDPVLGT